MQKPFRTQPALFVPAAELDHPALRALDDAESLLDWSEIERLLSSIYGSRTGRPSYPLLTLFRGLLLGVWYGLSDVQLSQCLYRDLLFRRFCRLELGGGVPDATTLGRFRSRLVKHDLWELLLGEVNRQLEEQHIVMTEGRINIVDATPVEAARSGRGKGKDGTAVREALDGQPELRAAFAPLLSLLASARTALQRADAAVAARAQAEDACQLSMTAPRVGPVRALAFASVVGAPERFAKSRAVGAYVGLASRRWQSGEVDHSGRISRHGDAMLRSLLYECASCLLTRVRRAHSLKDWARRVKKRTGHKKACVALARRRAAILHRMMVTGEAFRWPEARPAAT